MWPFSRDGAQNLRSAQPYWLIRNGIADSSPYLRTSLECDVAIIGAGITGALIAHALTQAGRRVVVLDRRDMALGSTCATTALLQYEIDTDLTELEGLLGWEDASAAYRAGVESVDILQRLSGSLPVDVNFARRRSLYLASSQADVDPLRAEYEARLRAGIEVEWLDAAQLESQFQCRRPAAILSAVGAQVDPFRLARALLHEAVGRGTKLFAGTRVATVAGRGDRLVLHTSEGHAITASHAIVACGYESLEFLPYRVARLFSTFALVTEPINEPHAVDTALIWETARPYLYLRGTPDGRLVLGGRDIPFKDMRAREAALQGRIERLSKDYRALFGRDLPPVAYSWGGTFAATEDGLPYIGRAPGTDPRLLFALCFGGNGISYGAQAGPILMALLEGRAHALSALFGFSRRNRQ